MFRQLADFLANLLFLARDTRENKEAITQLRREMDELTSVVDQLAMEFRNQHERDKLEREKLVLALENTLLRLEHRLPPEKPPKDRK